MDPQAMPDGLLVTVPVPVPVFVTARLKGIMVNVAVTFCAAFMVTVHVPVPLHPPPDQPVKVEVASGVAARVTNVPLLYEEEQVEPQVMPDGLLVTVPVPVPAFVTARL